MNKPLSAVFVVALLSGCADKGATPSRSSTSAASTSASTTTEATTTEATTTEATTTEAGAAWKRWKQSGVTSYRFHYVQSCFCIPRNGMIEVTDGVVTGFVADASTAGFDVPSNRANLPTVDSLLREAARAEREATGARGIIYDPETGVPTFAHIDFDKNAIDDEIDWTITDFTPTSAA
jgi:Family of unknown function (DUF6174)